MTTQNGTALLEKLRDTDANIRRKAVLGLADTTDKDAIDALCQALGDANKGVQNAALATLSRVRHAQTVKSLLPVIQGSDLNTRNAGMTILKNLGTMPIPHLVEAIGKASDVDEIIQILVVLGNIGSPLATDHVMKFVTHEDDNVKTTAVEALGKIQDPKALGALINTYHQTDILRYSIVEALGNLGLADALPVLLGALDSEDVLEYFSAIGALGAMESPKGVDPLFAKLLKEEDAGTRRLIVKSLAQIETANPGSLAKLDRAKLRPIMPTLLEQEDAAEFHYVVKAAAAIGDEAYATPLLKALQHNDGDVVDSAFAGLLKLGTAAVKPALALIGQAPSPVVIKILEFLTKVPHQDVPRAIVGFKEHPEDSVRQVLARTLGANPSDTSFSVLKGLLADADETVRRNAVVAIKCMLNYDGALSALIGAFKDANGHVRREAAMALVGCPSAQVVEPLQNMLLTEPYGDVREAAAIALASRKDKAINKRLIELLEEKDSRIRETIAKTIYHTGAKEIVDGLIRSLEDKEWRVVTSACASLEHITDLKSIFPLKELLKNNDWQVRIAAISALRAFKSKELKNFFAPLIEDQNPTVAKLAVEALAELEDQSLAQTFRKNVNHPRWEVRYQIVKALGKMKVQDAVDALIQIVEKDQNNGVKAKALLALAKIQSKKAVNCALELLDHTDRDLVIAAIKFFLEFQNTTVTDLEARLTKIFLHQPWIKNYFIKSFAENKSPLLESVLRAVSTPREVRVIDRADSQPRGNGKEISNEEALLLSEIIVEKCGIHVPQRQAIESRLIRDRNKFYINTWIEYYHALKYGSDDQKILHSLFDTITDPRTKFFDEPHQNRVLIDSVIPEMIEQKIKAGQKEIRILSAGCSFGPELYSLAMAILEEIHSDRVKIVLTGVDISHICLNTAKRGIYKREMLRTVDKKYIDLYFEDDRGDLRIKDEVKNISDFKFLNLSVSHELEDLEAFDIIVCRSVFNSFAQAEKEKLAETIYNVLTPGGILLISNRESLYNVTKAFKLLTYDKTVIYKKA